MRRRRTEGQRGEEGGKDEKTTRRERGRKKR